MKRTIAFTMLLLAGLLPGWAGTFAAQNLPPQAFFGRFSGGGIASNADSLYFAVTARDFDVTIAPAGRGFRVDWTSVIRRGGAWAVSDRVGAHAALGHSSSGAAAPARF